MRQTSGPAAHRKTGAFNMQNKFIIPDLFYDPSLRVPGIYSITCQPTGKVYVGSAVNVSLRWRGHFRHLETGSHHCTYLQRAWNKYGASVFAFALIEACQSESLRVREQFHIDAVSIDRRFNSSPTAGSLLGFKMRPESLETMRVAHTGFRHSEETKARARIARAGIATRPAGWKMSEEGKRKLRLPRSPLSPEHRAASVAILDRFRHRIRGEKEREALAKGHRFLSDEQVAAARVMYLDGKSMSAISQELKVAGRKAIERAIRGIGSYGTIGEPVTQVVSRPCSDEQKLKLSAATKGRPKSAETREKMRKAQILRRHPTQ